MNREGGSLLEERQRPPQRPIPEPLQDWPSLARGEIPEELRAERILWGKAHGADSDFRILAATPGIEGAGSDPARDFYLGVEDQSQKVVLWRAVSPQVHLAVGCYPSLAVDGAGRSSHLEKDILVWRHPQEVPAVLGALLWAPRVSRIGEEDRWGDPGTVDWNDPMARHLLEPAERPTVQVTEEILAQGIEAALEAVRQGLPAQAVETFYEDLLAGRRPALFPALDGPGAAAILAGLLLPLERSLADRLSLASAIPSTRFHHRKLARTFDGVGTSNAATTWPDRADQVAGGDRRAAVVLARAVLEGDPSLLAAPPTRGTRRPAASGQIDLALWGPTAAGKTVFLAQLHLQPGTVPGGWEVYPTEQSRDFIDSMRRMVRLDNRFPTATQVGTSEEIAYRFHRPEDDRTARLIIEDRAGIELQELHEAARTRLASAHGLILLIDLERNEGELETQLGRALDWLNTNGEVAEWKESRPVAICLSKADLRISNGKDLDLAWKEPHRFAERLLPRKLADLLHARLDRYRLFPVSAAGVRRVWGSVEPVVFLDERLTPRMCPDAPALNLLAPFAWLLGELEGAP